MRAAYLANIRFPSERAHSAQIESMCEAFPRVGLTVDLFVSTRRFTDDARLDQFRYTFKVIKLPYGYFNAKRKLVFYFSEAVFTLSFIIRNFSKKYDYFFSRSDVIVFLLTFFIPSKKLLWEVHDLRNNFLTKYLLWRTIKIVVTSKGLLDYYHSIKYENVLLAYNGVSEDFFSDVTPKIDIRRTLRIDQNDFVALYIGGFDQWKGVETFFEASNILSNVNFVAVGGSNLEINNYSKIYPNVTFLGQLPYKDLKINQQVADVLIVPNTAKNELSEKFTSPLKLFAHMTSGIPIVASNTQSIKSIVDDPYVTFSTPDSPEALAESIKTVRRHYEEKKGKALELVEISRRYTWENRAKRISDFLTV